MAAPTVDPAPAGSAPRVPRSARSLRLLARALPAIAAGVVLYLSFPPRELWWLAPPVFAVLGVVLRGVRARRGFLLGFLFGLGFLVPLLSWTGGFVGALPWLALCVVEAIAFGLAGAGMAVTSRLPAAPVWGAAVWVGVEALRSRFPFGGLPWGRVGFGQPEGLFLHTASVGGVPLLSFVTVLAGLALGELVRRLARREGRAAVVPAVLLVLALVAGPVASLIPATVNGPSKSITVAAIQGNVPRLGLDFNAQRRAVLDNHVTVTEQLAADVAAGRRPQPDVVIWPENSSDIDPFRNADAAALISRAAAAIKAPILVGSVLVNAGGTDSNAVLVWDPVLGPIARNDKRRIQPFGEYMPWRSFFRIFSSYVDRAGNFVPGPGPGVLQAGGADIGIAICWEIAFDDLVDDSVSAGATMLAVPSNNATFGLSEMTYQQLAMSRVRAVEHDRPVVVATTSGVSATITPEGTVTGSTGQFVPGTLVAVETLEDTTTLATRLRSVPEWVLTAAGVMAIGAALLAGRRARRGAAAAQEGAGSRTGSEDAPRAGEDVDG
ncbi:apolipoprotein N-acyltransferase [Pseudonocardia sp. RS11V-5]|uniref:apolipoprotein N-acyltransferase n=1 Tax=Pseudonocardia terrae TaxID=2905831 RepID=UPI001E2CE507|nr:apolipoprotein N-acyltransferase [Pseudonocardia terrae]MCE3552032.1 apolipoprotein N-acyltransferase [Pseudonocardia terrae]